VQFFPVFGGIFASRTLRHDSKTWHTIPQSCNFIIEIGAISLLNHVMSRLLNRLVTVVVLIIVIIIVGRRLPLAIV
jgi:hypothetical protein